jgi:hypothetical protein
MGRSFGTAVNATSDRILDVACFKLLRDSDVLNLGFAAALFESGFEIKFAINVKLEANERFDDGL